MNLNKIIGAVEIGTSKILVLVGEIVGRRSLNIIGLGQSTAMGIKKGEIVDFHAASNATHAAILGAEKNASTIIEAVFLSQSGGHLKGFYNRGSVSVSAPDNMTSRSDIARAVESAKRKELPPGRVFIHHIRNGFLLDGQPVDNPLNLKGDRLEVGYWHVHGHEKRVSDHIHVINGFGLKVKDMIISSIASGSMVASETEKKNGVLVLDIGCGTTDYALYGKGNILKTGVIGIGGDHFTNDLSLGLRINAGQAEKLKLENGNAILEKEKRTEKVWLFGDLTIGDRAIPESAIYKIIRARVEELFRIVKMELGGALNREDVAGGVILTGGASRLKNIAEVGAEVLGIRTRIGENPSWVRADLREPEYSCALGLLYYGLTAQRSEDKKPSPGGIMKKMAAMFSL